MYVAKTCFYCSQAVNVLPALLITPLYSVVSIAPPMPLSYFKRVDVPEYMRCVGMRVAFKWFTFHIGVELHESR